MADEVNKYLKDARRRWASRCPRAMRPMLEQMAKMGLLTDKSGKKIKDVEKSGIKFAMTMCEGFEKMIDSVDSLDERPRRLARRRARQDEGQGRGHPRHDQHQGRIRRQAAAEAQERHDSVTRLPGRHEGLRGLRRRHARHAARAGSRRARDRGEVGIGAASRRRERAGVTIIINAQGSFFDTPGDLAAARRQGQSPRSPPSTA